LQTQYSLLYSRWYLTSFQLNFIATNPKGKFDPNQNLSVNIALASPLLSRFDIIIILIDSQNEEWDRTVSKFILSAEIKATGGKQDKSDSSESSEPELWSLEKIQAYVSYVKSKYSPKMTPDANIVIQKYYQMQRGSDVRNAARTTVRYLS
jgi:DNA helicase MCM9